jgi:flagella basal body P-ring formation protein FlgA
LLGDLVGVQDPGGELARASVDRAVAAAPLVGQTLRIERGRLQRLVAQWGVPEASVQWSGAAFIEVRKETQQIDAATLCRTATDALRRAAVALPNTVELDLRCEYVAAAIPVSRGLSEPRAQSEGLKLLDGLQNVVVSIDVAQRRERVANVPVRVTLEAPMWCAGESLASGQPIAASKFVVCKRPVQRAEQWAMAGQALPGGRLKRALRAGELLAAADVAGGDVQLRGDAVTVVYQAGGLMLETAGELGQDARVGEAVQVRLRNGGAPISGRLAAVRRVDIEGQP